MKKRVKVIKVKTKPKIDHFSAVDSDQDIHSEINDLLSKIQKTLDADDFPPLLEENKAKIFIVQSVINNSSIKEDIKPPLRLALISLGQINESYETILPPMKIGLTSSAKSISDTAVQYVSTPFPLRLILNLVKSFDSLNKSLGMYEAEKEKVKNRISDSENAVIISRNAILEITSLQPAVNPQPSSLSLQPDVIPQPSLEPVVNPQPSVPSLQPVINPQPIKDSQPSSPLQPTINLQPSSPSSQPTMTPQIVMEPVVVKPSIGDKEYWLKNGSPTTSLIIAIIVLFALFMFLK